MGIQVEFNPDLALRNISEFETGRRKEAECIPHPLEAGKVYPFLKNGQRLYWLHGEIPLLQTQGNEKLSRPRASVVIRWAKHFVDRGKVFTTGEFEVIDVFKDKKIHFESYARTEYKK
jgi:hypothetical protein